MNNSNLPATAQTVANEQRQGTASEATAPLSDPLADRAGDVSPQPAWQSAQAADAVIIDVCSDAERKRVGLVPGAIALASERWPGMQRNTTAFEQGLHQKIGSRGALRRLMRCRNGARSVAAARYATALGLEAHLQRRQGFRGQARPERTLRP